MSALGLTVGALEFVVAIALAVASMLLLQSDVFSVIPTVQLH